MDRWLPPNDALGVTWGSTSCQRFGQNLVKAVDLVKYVEAMGLEPTDLLTASQALYQLSYAPVVGHTISGARPRRP